MTSTHTKCSNCTWSGARDCVPSEIPLPDFSRIDKEIERLEKLETEAEEFLELKERRTNYMGEDVERRIALFHEEVRRELRTVNEDARSARATLSRLRKEKKLLKRREQQVLSEGLKNVEELEQLEALEQLNRDIAAVPHMVAGEDTVAVGNVPVSSPDERFPSRVLTPLHPGTGLQGVAQFDAFVAERFVFHGFSDISGVFADN